MIELETILKSILEAALPVLVLIGKGTLTSALMIVLSWFSVEHLFGLVPRLRRASPDLKRALAILCGQAAVFVAHGTNLIDFGPGRQGWWLAALFGFLGGGLAPWLHGVLKAKFPDVTNTPPDSIPAGVGSVQ